MDDAEFQLHVQRFNWIFNSQQSQVLNMTGNHDVGLRQWFNPAAMQRHARTFGKPNYVAPLGQFDLVVLDAIGLVSPRTSIETEARVFLQTLLRPSVRPRILFTHIPLYRPDEQFCGPRRTKKSIHAAFGVSYQNLLSQALSAEILQTVQPKFVLSGDDHSPCLYEHSYVGREGQTERVKEYTVATFSWYVGL